ncbi:MAG TPA: TonB-dependent receptor [Phycisphaerae bacterium]|nr:TonB-dependent receptor [Phycisphaerae bacterium]
MAKYPDVRSIGTRRLKTKVHWLSLAVMSASIFALAPAASAEIPTASATAPSSTAPPSSLPSEISNPELTPLASTQPSTAPTTVPTTQITPSSQPAIALNKVVVSSSLDVAREQIAPALGAVTYTITPQQIQAIPGGENASFQQVLLRAPGVVEDSFGQIHVRGEHGNVMYRVNGVLLPQPLSGFGQEIDTHLIQSVTLITGSLPAQFGFHTAGIVDVTTKSGATLKTNELSLYGGSHQTLQSNLVAGGTAGQLDYFINASTNYNDLGIENPTSGHEAIHDITNQQRLFGYFNYTIDDTSRVSFLFNAANGDFEIPNSGGIPATFPLAGHDYTTANSRTIDETQNEQKYYNVIAYQKSFERFNFQISAFSTYDQIHFQPDIPNDLMFQGVAGNVYNNAVTNGLQFDSAYMINEQHTLRAGFTLDYINENLNTNTYVFHTDSSGNPTSDVPFNIADNSGNYASEDGAYIQDEWKMSDPFTLNYGLRYDYFHSSFDNEGQLSPRINLVWTIDKATTAHIGYSRYFVTPPPQNLGVAQVAPFNNTTNAGNANGPGGTLLADGGKAERSNYFDAGISHQIIQPWSVTLDGFFKQAHNLIDEGQFGAPVIESPFNYHTGRVYGAELSSTYTQNGLSLFGNGSWVVTEAHDIDSQQYLIEPDEYAYIKNHDIHLDHEGEFTVSAGASYTFNKNKDMVYVDWLYGNGLRRGFANTAKEPEYYPVNIGCQHIFKLDGDNGRQAIKLRFDIVNVFDESYQLRDGSGIGVGAPQFGARRGFFVGLAYDF